MLPLLLYEAAWLFLFQQRELDMKKRKLDEGNIGLALKIFLLGKGCKDKAISNKVTRRQMFSRSVHRPVRSAPLLVKYAQLCEVPDVPSAAHTGATKPLSTSVRLRMPRLYFLL